MRIHQVDSFTTEPFRGNPAGVCLLEEPRDARWMQDVAAEMNLAETAFLERRGPGEFGLRWFSPTLEVDLCGHATLASAHTLWEWGEQCAQLRFATRSGELRAERAGGRIRLDFPAAPPSAVPVAPGLVEALGVVPGWIGRSRTDYLVELADEAAVRAVEPDFAAIRALGVRGVIVTARAAAETEADFVSRFFAPSVGVDEDPVTGSAHCCLGPYWCDKLGRAELVGYQASRRGGYVHVAPAGDRVALTGSAVTVLRGEID
jgi:PhzF family phenazine biosynthesis protein